MIVQSEVVSERVITQAVQQACEGKTVLIRVSVNKWGVAKRVMGYPGVCVAFVRDGVEVRKALP